MWRVNTYIHGKKALWRLVVTYIAFWWVIGRWYYKGVIPLICKSLFRKKIDINEPIVWFDFIANFRLQLSFYHKLCSLWIFLSQNVAFIIIYFYHKHSLWIFFYSHFVLSILNLLQDLFEFEAWDKWIRLLALGLSERTNQVYFFS